jgi:hypothetical protein
VHASQQAGHGRDRTRVRYEDVALACNRVLAEGLYDLKLLPVSVEEALDKESMVYRRWTLARLRPHARPRRARLLGRAQGALSGTGPSARTTC